VRVGLVWMRVDTLTEER